MAVDYFDKGNQAVVGDSLGMSILEWGNVLRGAIFMLEHGTQLSVEYIGSSLIGPFELRLVRAILIGLDALWYIEIPLFVW